MPKVFKVDGVALPDGAILMEGGHTRLSPGIGGLPVSAWYCEPGIGTINIDDPGGDYTLAGWHTFTVDDTDSVGTERQWSGWLIGRRVTRGPYKDGPARVWEVDILEINALFGLQVFRANSAQRPAETDVERMQFLIASAPMATTPVHDDGRLNTAGPASLAAAEFVRSFPVDMADNAAGQSGKNVYAYWSHDDDEIGFHYDLVGAGPDCTLRISNVIADTDSTTFYPFLDAELDGDAYGVYTGVLLDYVGGSVYGENDTLISELSPTEFSPSEFKRDQMIRSDRIGKLTTANAFLATYLAAAAVEKESITVGITVPASQVGLIQAGMNVDVKLTHIPSLEDFTSLPIIRMSKAPTPERTDTWDVRLELSENVKTTLAVGGDPGDLPTDPEDTGHWWEGFGDVENDIGAQNVPGASPPWAEGTYNWSYTMAESPKPDETYASSGWVAATSGASKPFGIWKGPGTTSPGGDTTTYTGTIVVASDGSYTGDGHFVGAGDFILGNSYYFNGQTAGPHSPKPHKTTAFSFFWDFIDPSSDTDPIPPGAGTWIVNETPSPAADAVTVTFSTRWPFVDSSLQVWVDNTEQTRAVVSTDGLAGTFTLAFAPTTSEHLKVRYQSRA